MNESRPKTPVSLYLVVGLLAAFGALMLVRMILGWLFSPVMILAVVAAVVAVLSAMARRGNR